MGWNRVTADLASPGRGGWRAVRPSASPALKIAEAALLDASLEDAIVTLPSARQNKGILFWGKRIDAPGTAFVAELQVYDTTESIEGSPTYSFAIEGGSVLLAAGPDGIWYIVAEIV